MSTAKVYISAHGMGNMDICEGPMNAEWYYTAFWVTNETLRRNLFHRSFFHMSRQHFFNHMLHSNIFWVTAVQICHPQKTIRVLWNPEHLAFLQQQVCTSPDTCSCCKFWWNKHQLKLLSLFSCISHFVSDGFCCCRSHHHAGERGSLHCVRSHQRRLWEDSSGDPQQNSGRPHSSKRWPAQDTVTPSVWLWLYFQSLLSDLMCATLRPAQLPHPEEHALRGVDCVRNTNGNAAGNHAGGRLWWRSHDPERQSYYHQDGPTGH